MKLFSHRKGLKQVRTTLQVDSMDPELRSRLWDVVTETYWSLAHGGYLPDPRNSSLQDAMKNLWHFYFKRPMDTIGSDWSAIRRDLRSHFFSCDWNEVYDFIEYLPIAFPYRSTNESFRNACNLVLEQELAGYRFVGTQVTQITAEEEIAEVEGATQMGGRLEPVSRHIEQSLSLLADRRKPDYRNSIKEAISGVEALSQIVGGSPKATLSDAFKKMEAKVRIHPALRGAFEKLYGYTSDAEGIRHALLEEPNLGFDDAKYMLVCCSAFVNYVVAKAAASGMQF